ncbi:hypothetical protein ACIBO2_23945 [Nonomuraea sp. NPDC050022]|uniref:hypothetical protein n=1 Tax=Nonomuraea sp. NPDC050022 TaxID=3364358 RepID=UPI0037A4B912
MAANQRRHRLAAETIAVAGDRQTLSLVTDSTTCGAVQQMLEPIGLDVPAVIGQLPGILPRHISQQAPEQVRKGRAAQAG